LAHQEVAGGVGSAGGVPTVAESTAAAVVICGGISDGVGDSRHLGSIPSARNKRRTRRSFSARRWRLGRHRIVALPSGHGGGAGVLGGGRGSEPGREREGRGGPWRPGAALGSHLDLKAASRRWHSGDPAQDTQVCCLLGEEERKFLQKTP
jgi:hypothetical protein